MMITMMRTILLGAAIDREHVDEVKHQDDDQEGDQHANDDVHAYDPFSMESLA